MKSLMLAVIIVLLIAVAVLSIKNFLIKKSATEIAEAFSFRLKSDTNTLIDISSNDRHMRKLASKINNELRELRTQRHRYLQGDAELKNAVTNISHDLRTPLTAIRGYLDLLDEEENSENAQRYIGIIKNRCEMLVRLTEELFRYSVIVSDSGDHIKENVSVNAALEESVAAFYTALKEKGITPTIKMPEKDVMRTLERSALMRVFSNLLNNAVKYSDGDLDILLSENGEMAFTNTAAKLDKLQAERLFDRFYTVETADNSTGLGLSIARALVEQMDGSISAQYANGKLTVRVCL